MNKTRKSLQILGYTALVLLGSSAWAENVHLGKDVASKEEIINLLMPSPANMKTRGLRMRSETPEDAPAIQDTQPSPAEQAAAAEPKSISLEIYFAFDSAALSPEAMAQLAPVGEALRSDELQNLGFELEGHTDASGDASYNMTLSERRADSVRQFFLEEFGVPADRLQAYGRGETQLLDPEHPGSGKNRRVKIIAR